VIPEVRREPLTRRWTIVAPARALRPAGEADGPCPFCPGNEEQTPDEVLAYRDPASAPNGPGWWVRAFANLFPAAGPFAGEARAEGIFDAAPAHGRHEVIVETAEHDADLATMVPEQAAEIVWAYRDRVRSLEDDARVRHVSVFRNRGALSGSTLAHPHSQVVATAIVPSDVAHEVEGVVRYHDLRGTCAACDTIAAEVRAAERVVLDDPSFVLLAPFASPFPYHMRIIPRAHAVSIAALERPAIEALARGLQEACRALCVLHGADTSYNVCVKVAPRWNSSLREAFHWYVDVFPRLSPGPAGFELGTGAYINTVAPEAAARALRATRAHVAL